MAKLLGGTTVYGLLSTTGTIFASGGNSILWNNAYNTSVLYQNISSSFATNTLLQSTSALLTPFTTTNTLTSQLVLNTSINSLTGNWNSTYSTVSLLSSTWSTGVSGGGAGDPAVNSLVISNSGYWNSTYSTVSLLSSTWSTGVSGGGAGDPAVNSLVISNSGYWNTAYDFSTIFSQNSSIYNETYTTVAANSALWGMGLTPYGELTSALFTGDGSTNTFDLSSTAPFTQSAGYIVSLNGSLQVPDIDYSILYSSGTNRVVTNFVPRLGSSLSVITLSNKPIPNQITTLVGVASANWNSVYNTTNSLSGDWNSVYSYVSLTSSTNNPDYNSSIFAKLSSASSAGGLFYDVENSNFNAVATKQYLVDTSSNIVVGTLPSSPSVGDTINFEDASGTWFTRPFILNNNGNLIESFNESLTANINSYKFKTVFLGGVYGWRLF